MVMSKSTLTTKIKSYFSLFCSWFVKMCMGACVCVCVRVCVCVTKFACVVECLICLFLCHITHPISAPHKSGDNDPSVNPVWWEFSEIWHIDLSGLRNGICYLSRHLKHIIIIIIYSKCIQANTSATLHGGIMLHMPPTKILVSYPRKTKNKSHTKESTFPNPPMTGCRIVAAGFCLPWWSLEMCRRVDWLIDCFKSI